MSQLVVDKLMTEYQVSGSGQPVVLLHGWGDDLSTFKHLQAKLSSNYKVYSLDLPGFGKTQAPNETWGLDDYAKFVASFLDKLSAKPYALVGHSNGGAIAIRAVGRGTIKTTKLVLLAASGIRGQYKGRNLALRLVAKTGKLLVSPLPKRVKNRVRSKMYKTIGSDMLVAEHLQDTFKKVVTDDVRADAAQINTPTLLIYGDKDSATPISFAEKFNKQLANGKLVTIPGVGHFVHHEASNKVARTIEEFLND